MNGYGFSYLAGAVTSSLWWVTAIIDPACAGLATVATFVSLVAAVLTSD